MSALPTYAGVLTPDGYVLTKLLPEDGERVPEWPVYLTDRERFRFPHGPAADYWLKHNGGGVILAAFDLRGNVIERVVIEPAPRPLWHDTAGIEAESARIRQIGRAMDDELRAMDDALDQADDALATWRRQRRAVEAEMDREEEALA